MRVVHVVDSMGPKAAGVSAAAADMVAFQRGAGQDVAFVTGDGVDSDRLGACGGGGGSLAGRIWRALQWAELVHIHALWLWTTTLAGHMARAGRRPFVITPHGMLDPWALRQGRWKKALVLRMSELPILNGSAAVHALCKAEGIAARQCGVRSRIAVIPPGLAETWLAPEPRGPSGVLEIVFLGRLHPKKGVDLLIKAFGKARAHHPNWQLRIVGPDQANMLVGLRALVYASGLNNVVHFEGPAYGERKRTILDEAAVFVLPSYSEGVPVAVLEAMARGVPVIVSRACNIPEVETEGAGLLVDPEVESIASALGRVMAASDGTRFEMGGRGIALVTKGYSAAKSGESMLELYRSIAAPKTDRSYLGK